LGSLGKDKEFLENRYGLIGKLLLDYFVICVKMDTEDLLWNGTESK